MIPGGGTTYHLHGGGGSARRFQHGNRIGLGIEGINGARWPMHIAAGEGTAPDTRRAQRLILGPVAGIGMAHFRQHHVGKAAIHVAAGRRNQVGQQRGPHVGEFGRDRVGEFQFRLATTKQSGMGFGQEGPGDRLVEAARREDAAAAEHALLQGVQHRLGDGARALHGGGRNVVEAIDAADLLDEIGLAIDIRPPRRHGAIECLGHLVDAKAQA